jgi:hypothetical protein
MIVFPSREKRGDSSALCAGGDVSCVRDPSRPTRHSAQCVAKKIALSLCSCDWTTTERPPGAQASAPQARSGAETSCRGFQSGGAAATSRLWFVAMRSMPAVNTSLPPHKAM